MDTAEALLKAIRVPRQVIIHEHVGPLKVQALAGITADELATYVAPADYERPSVPVPQPAYNPDRPHLAYPPAAYERVLAMPDEAFWDSVDSSPPVPQVGVEPTPYGV